MGSFTETLRPCRDSDGAAKLRALCTSVQIKETVLLASRNRARGAWAQKEEPEDSIGIVRMRAVCKDRRLGRRGRRAPESVHD